MSGQASDLPCTGETRSSPLRLLRVGPLFIFSAVTKIHPPTQTLFVFIRCRQNPSSSPRICRRELIAIKTPNKSDIKGPKTAQWSSYAAEIASSFKRRPRCHPLHTKHAKVLAPPQRQGASALLPQVMPTIAKVLNECNTAARVGGCSDFLR